MKLSGIITRRYSYLRDSYAIDYRSLALFRIAVGLVVLIDLFRRFQHSLALYSDSGVLPRRDAISGISPSRWSLLFVNGSPEFVKAFIVLGMVAAIALILGWRTRLASIVLWLVIISIQVRNVGVNDGSDNLIRITLFWSMFLPLGQKWSLDNANRSGEDEPRIGWATTVVSVAGFGLILQQAYMYWFTAMLKDGPRWTEDGTALYYALGMNHVNRGFGEWLFQSGHSSVLATLTVATLIIEFAIPIMLLLPLRNAFLRTCAVFLIWSLHLGIIFMMQVELFPLISIASAIGLLPAVFWNSLLPRVAETFSRITRLPVPTFRTGQLVPKGARELVADHERVGHAKLHFISPPLKNVLSGKVFINVVCVFAILLSTLSNLGNVSSYSMPSQLNSITFATGLQQSWRMFAPQPGANTIWYVAEGTLVSGEKVDLLVPLAENDLSIRTAPVWDQSDNVIYPNKFWRKYFTSIRNRETPKVRFANYACRTWNSTYSGGDRLEHVSLTRATSRTLENSERDEPVYTDLGSWDCRY